MKTLGWELINKNDMEYHHHREELDVVEEHMETLDYPRPTEKVTQTKTSILNLKNIKISNRNIQLKNFILKQLQHHHNIISSHEFDIGRIPNTVFHIKFKPNINTEPIQCPEYPHNMLHTDEIERQLKYLHKIGFIKPSISPWRFPTFIVSKKTGDARIVFDYRLLNIITESMSYPLPSIETLINKFYNKHYISTIDIKSGYWNIPLSSEDTPKTAFVFNGKLWEWCVLPFGLKNAPPFFQMTMNKLFHDMPYVIVYMDDITILSDDPIQHQQHLLSVFNRLNQYNIKIRIDKCAFAQRSVEYLGFNVDANGCHITNKYKSKIINIPTPNNKKQLQRFIGLIQYLYKFIPSLQLELKPFHNFMKKNAIFQWTNELDKLFNSIKTKVQNAKILHHPDLSLPFEVYCDASIDGIGAVLAQRTHDKKLKIVQFCSKLFGQTQRNWHISEQEIYSVIYAVEKWRKYLIGNKFTVFTDHKNLQELFNRAKNFRAGKLYRWAVRLQEYEFVAKYIPGQKNIFADYLSRDALHTVLPLVDTPPSIKTTNILYIYTKHLINNLLSKSDVIIPPQIQSSNTSLYILKQSKSFLPSLNPTTKHIDDVIGESDDDDDIDTTTNVNTTPQTTTSSKSPYNYYTHYLHHNIPSNPSIPIPKPSHPHNTRYQKHLKESAITHNNKYKQLQPISDDIIIDPDEPLNYIEKSNDKIISNKPSQFTYNKSLFIPTNIPILNNYNINNLSNQNILQKQINDPLLYPIIEYLNTHNKFLLSDLPKYLYRFVLSGRYYISKTSKLLLYRNKSKECIVIPASLRNSILKWAHNNVHHGYDRMMKRLEERYWWPLMRKDVAKLAATCHSCQSVKGGNNIPFKSGSISTFSAKNIFELISIDICGPLPQTDNGNRYIVSIIDKFSRFCLLIPVKNIKTLTIIKAYERWLSLFGPPGAVLSDNGSQFISEIYKTYNKNFKINIKYSSPYYPETNGQIERLHRWIKERLTLISIDLGTNFIDEDNWDEYIPLIQHSYNSTPNNITKYSPNKIIFGNDFKLYLDRINNIQSTKTTPSEFIKMMKYNKSIITNNAISNQDKYDKIRTKTYNKHRKIPFEYNVGDNVLINIKRRYVGNKSKFTPTWIGPFEIIHINDKQYTVREINNDNNIQKINIRFIKPYKISPYITILNKSLSMITNDDKIDGLRNYEKIYQYAIKRLIV